MVTTVDVLAEQLQLSIGDLAARSGLTESRVEAIVSGRWLPNPAERRALAESLGTTVDAIDWGHTMNPRNVRYHRFGLPEDF